MDSATAQHLIYKAAHELNHGKGSIQTPLGKSSIHTPYLIPNSPDNQRNALSQSAIHSLNNQGIQRIESLKKVSHQGSF
jgi:hypothetical protein